MSILLAALTLSASLAAQDGGKIAWTGKSGDPKVAMAEANRQKRPMMLFFTSTGCGPCKKLSAGAFSDAAVVQAAERLTCVYIECDWGKSNADLSGLYKVDSYPTVLFCGPDGRPIAPLQSREPEAVAKQMTEVADKFGAKAEVPPQPIELASYAVPDAFRAGVALKKRVLLFFRDDSPASLSVATALTDPALKKILSGFALGSDVYTKGTGSSAKFDVTRAPTLLVLDPTVPKPEAKPLARIEGSRSARELIRELETLAPAEPGAPSADPRPAPKEPEEKLSDDEIDRRFIAARVGVAKDMMKQGKKDKAIEIYEDIIKTYPKHVDTVTVKKLLAEARK